MKYPDLQTDAEGQMIQETSRSKMISGSRVTEPVALSKFEEKEFRKGFVPSRASQFRMFDKKSKRNSALRSWFPGGFGP